MNDVTAQADEVGSLLVVDHPLIKHKLSLLRDVGTSTVKFRQLLNEIGLLLGYEATRDLPMETRTISTPICDMEAPVLAGKKMCLVSVLRAGEGLLHGMMELVPSARVAHVGLARDPVTLKPKEYYFNAPQDLDKRLCIVVDPMLATGGSAIDAVELMKKKGARNIRQLSVLAAPEGIAAFRKAHPDVPLIVAAIDERLNEKGYIVPGLGDAGDRLFGTKVEH